MDSVPYYFATEYSIEEINSCQHEIAETTA